MLSRRCRHEKEKFLMENTGNWGRWPYLPLIVILGNLHWCVVLCFRLFERKSPRARDPKTHFVKS